MEERVIVERERVGNFVDDLEPRLRNMLVRQRIRTARLRRSSFSASSVSLPASRARSSSNFAISSSRVSVLLPHFSRMGGQDRAHQRAIEEIGEGGGLDAHLAGALKGVSQRAGTRRGAGDRMGAIAPDVMLVFGDVGEVREIVIARTIASVWSALKLSSVASSSRRAAASLSRWKRIEARRICSTSSKTSSPSCSRTVSPRIRPSRRMSSRKGTSFSSEVRGVSFWILAVMAIGAHPLPRILRMLHCGRIGCKAER